MGRYLSHIEHVVLADGTEVFHVEWEYETGGRYRESFYSSEELDAAIAASDSPR